MADGAPVGLKVRAAEKMTAASFVYERLRQDILKGAFKPGQRLHIELVARRHGVGTKDRHQRAGEDTLLA